MNLVAIPTKGATDLLFPLLDTLLKDRSVNLVILDNGMPTDVFDRLPDHARLSIRDCKDMGIYAMWNRGFQFAQDRAADTLSLLNDDIAIDDRFIRCLEEAIYLQALWVACPDYKELGGRGVDVVTGTYKDGGMSGFAFMLRVNRFDKPPFDEQFGFWGGDDQFAKDVVDAGGTIGYVRGVKCEHIGGATSTQEAERVAAMVSKDIDLMKARSLW